MVITYKSPLWLGALALSASLMLSGCDNSQSNQGTQSSSAPETTQTAETSEAAQTAPVSSYTLLDVAEAAALLGEGARAVDARDSNAFNGWALENEARGGHLPGATSLDLAWVEHKLEGVEALVQAKGLIGPDLLVYGYSRAQAEQLADWLVSQGVAADKIRILADFAAWSADTQQPLEALPRYQELVHARWLEAALKSEQPPKLIEVSWGAGDDYKKAHIPGAVHMNTDWIEAEPLWNKRADDELVATMLKLGVSVDTPVVVYGADSTPPARALVIMKYLGVKDVRLLNGGLAAWQRAGLPVVEGEELPEPIAAFGVEAPAAPEVIISTERAKELLAADDAELVSIRSWVEYIGETSGYNYIKPKGRIAGAVWGHAGSDPWHLEDFRNLDMTLRDYHEIEAFWAEWGITPNKTLSFYCGTGWRAAETWFYARLMGYPDISLYDGGWYEWSSDPANPVEQGEPEH